MAKLYGVGVGPGDKELLTIKAIKTIGKCDVIVVPSAMSGGKSIAHEVAEEYINKDSEVLVKHFPMGEKNRNLKYMKHLKLLKKN